MPRAYPKRACALCGRVVRAGEYLSRRVAGAPGSGRCVDCIGEGNRSRRDPELIVIEPGKRYRDDVGAQLFVAYFAGGATLEQVGAAFGVTRERLRQIETVALTKLHRALGRRGIDARAALSSFADDDVVDEPRAAAAA